MAGFLDPKSQIIDMVLTGHGKLLLSQGELRFVYWAAYDDGIVYHQSGSLTEEPFQREATIGYPMFDLLGNDTTNVNYALMTVPPGWDVVPSATLDTDRTQINVNQQPIVQEYIRTDTSGTRIDTNIQPVQMGVIRSNSSVMNVVAQYTKSSYPKNHQLEGFYVRVLVAQTASLATTGAFGEVVPEKKRYIEQHHTLSDDSELVVGPELMVGVVSPGE